MENYYNILGLPTNSNVTDYDVSKAYRKLALENHPDKNPNGTEKFQKISEAYDALKTEERRKKYATAQQQQTPDNKKSFGDAMTIYYEFFFEIPKQQVQPQPVPHQRVSQISWENAEELVRRAVENEQRDFDCVSIVLRRLNEQISQHLEAQKQSSNYSHQAVSRDKLRRALDF